MEFHARLMEFFICWNQPFQLDWLAQNDGEEYGRQLPSDCVEKPGDTQSIFRETWREGKKKFKTRRTVEFSR